MDPVVTVVTVVKETGVMNLPSITVKPVNASGLVSMYHQE